MSQATTDRFDGHDLRDVLRPSDAWDTTDDTTSFGWYRQLTDIDEEHIAMDAGKEYCTLPVLDPGHGEVRVLNDDVVQVFTDEDIYHELVEMLERVFEIPVGYDVNWVDMREGRNAPGSFALIRLRRDGEVHAMSRDEPLTLVHEYKRGDYAGKSIYAMIQDGGVVPLTALGEILGDADTPTGAATTADEAVRGDDSIDVGINGWNWWRIEDSPFPLSLLR